MASTFHHHVAAACEGAGIEPSDLPDVVDEHAFSAIWGSAFEDLLARDQPDGRNIVDDYHKRRGWKESVPTREYMIGLRRSVLSLYPVGAEPVRGERRRPRRVPRVCGTWCAAVIPCGSPSGQVRAVYINGTGSRLA